MRILWGAVSTWAPVRPSQQSLLPPHSSGWAGMGFPLRIHTDYSWWFSCPSRACKRTLRISCSNTLPEIEVRLTKEESLSVCIKSYLSSRGLCIFTQSISHRAFCSVLPKKRLNICQKLPLAFKEGLSRGKKGACGIDLECFDSNCSRLHCIPPYYSSKPFFNVICSCTSIVCLVY